MTSVRSIDELEILLWLRKDDCERTTADIATALGMSESLAVSALQGLVQAQLVASSTTSPLHYWFAPSSSAVTPAIDQLAEAYATNRIELVMLISSKAIERVRASVKKMISLPHRTIR